MADAAEINWLLVDDEALLDACREHVHRASGPGGQRRNKVATAVRLVHLATGITAQGQDSRYQPENRKLAVKRLRVNLACRHRREVSLESLVVPDYVAECLSGGRLSVGRKDRRYWPIVGFVLDVLAACEGKLAPTAKAVGISTGNCSELLTSDKRALTAANDLRKAHGFGPLR